MERSWPSLEVFYTISRRHMERGSGEEKRARENVSDAVHRFSISIIKTWSLILQLL